MARERPHSSFFDYVLSIAVFRCWHLALFFTIWSTIIVVIDTYLEDVQIRIPDTLLLIVGGAIGFTTTYRANASFERWNEGRQSWATVLNCSRTFSRAVWFQVNDRMNDPYMSPEEQRARSLIEKKTAINLMEGFAVALKHYLRGEDGIYYTDLYHLVKYLPAYSFPQGIVAEETVFEVPEDEFDVDQKTLNDENGAQTMDEKHLSIPEPSERTPISPRFSTIPITPAPRDYHSIGEKDSVHDILAAKDEIFLIPGFKPPTLVATLFDFFPVNYFMKVYKKKRDVRLAKTAKGVAKMRAKMLNAKTSQNIPLEILLYLHSYVATLSARKTQENPTISAMNQAIQQLTEALTNLERIVSTPLPWSYRIHFWVVLTGWSLLLPFQVVEKMGWLTIPGSLIFSLVFYGFLTAGEEIENPFGYDRNDINMDHYTRNIIRNEMRAITSSAVPDPAQWIFTHSNDLALAGAKCDSNDCNGPNSGCNGYKNVARISPEDWIMRGPIDMMGCLRDVKCSH